MNPVGASALMSPADQVSAETEEQRRKRMLALQASKQLPAGMSAMTGNSIASGYGSALGMS